VGTGVGAKLGVLIKSGQAAETAAKVDVVVFDKTGTLTLGSPTITDFFQLDEPGEFVIHGSPVDPTTESSTVLRQHFLWLLASLERTSTHPLAKAVVTYAGDKVREPLAQPTSFTALTGRGASALVDGIPVACGNRAFAHALNLPIPRTVEGTCVFTLVGHGLVTKHARLILHLLLANQSAWCPWKVRIACGLSQLFPQTTSALIFDCLTISLCR
jgi:cation transport ATPase